MVQFLRTLRDFLDLRLFFRDTLVPFGVQGRQGGHAGLVGLAGGGVYLTLFCLPV
jgi:hypothetical protein